MSRLRLSSASRHCRGFAVIFAAGILAFASGAQTQAPPAAPESRKPCILLILADDLGCGDLGCYGQKNIKTPNLDQLATQGMRFTSFYGGSSLSAPSLTALLTGRDTGHGRNRGVEVVPLQLGDLVIPQVLKTRGYATLGVGKWGLGDISAPGRKGFDNWLGYLNDSESRNYFPTQLNETYQQEDHITLLPLNVSNKRGTYSDYQFTDSVLRYMDYSNPVDYNYFRPWFIYAAYTLPYSSPESGPASAAGAEIRDEGLYSDYAWSPAEKTRAAMITLLDTYVGQLLDKMKQLKNEKNTIVVFTSVTGPERDSDLDPNFFNSTGSLRGSKHDLYEGGIRVPLIIRWPLQMATNRVSDLPCAAWDLLPTLAEAGHAAAPTNLDGISFLPTLLNQEQTNRHDFFYWEIHDHGFKQALRTGDWKAVRPAAGVIPELYNLKADPGEKTNVAAQNPDVLKKIEGYLTTARTDSPDWPVQGPAGGQ